MNEKIKALAEIINELSKLNPEEISLDKDILQYMIKDLHLIYNKICSTETIE